MNNYPIEVAWPDLSPFAQGNTGTPYVFEFIATQPGPTVMLCALTHGNEVSGAIVLSDLLLRQLRPRRGRLIMAFNNIAAFEQFNLAAPDDSRFVDEDFNRLWSVERLKSCDTSVELERARQIKPFVDRADYLLDLHSMHEAAPPMFVCGLLEKNIQFGKLLGTPAHLMCDAGHSQGTRLRDFGDFNLSSSPKQALLLEAGQHWALSSLAVARSVTARALITTGQAQATDFPVTWTNQIFDSVQSTILVTDAIVATTNHFRFAKPFVGFEVLAANEVIGFETTFDQATRRQVSREIRAPYDNCVLVMPSERHAKPGVTVVRLGKYC
jgi:Succinylglutamate desuccinylase / Aspartoacylase family